MTITLNAVYRARAAIAAVAARTPLVPARSLGAEQGLDVRLKLETTQPTGAFKIRGAANALANLSAQQARNGVVCASTGNHGRAVSYAASRMDIPATVCLSELVPRNKVDAIEQLGARIEISGNSQDDAQQRAHSLAERDGLAEIPPFDHPDVIAGQGTIALELLEDFPELDTVLVPLSGGGLIAGIALVLKAANPAIRVIGISMERGAAMHASLQAGHPVAVTEEPSLADSLGGGIGMANRYTFDLVHTRVDATLLVSEAQIARAMRHLFINEGWVAEGAGAVGLVPLLEPCDVDLGEHIAVVISGKNVDMARFQQIVAAPPGP